MKKILLSMFLLGTLLSANAQVPSYVPKDSLKGWYPFNGNANDLSGNGNNGTVYGAKLTADRFGNTNKAYSFNGVDNWIQIADSDNLDLPNNLSINCWFYASSFDIISMIVSKHSPKCNNNEGTYTYGIWDVNGNSKINFSASPNFTASTFSNNQGIVSLNSWYQFVITYDDSQDVLKYYLNGILIDTKSLNFDILNNSFDIFIGKQDCGNLWHFNGTIDDIGIWNRVLNPSEVKDLYNGCKLAISTEPTNQSSNLNGQAQFTTMANDTTSSYQWQSNQSSLGWVNVPSNSIYSGVISKKLTVNNVQVNNHKQLFRVIAAKNSCKDTSVVAMLTVNDTCITSTTDTLYIKVNTSSLSNPVYNTVKVYPNPSSTQVIIDNGNFSTMGSYTAKIVNSIGQQVFQSVINQQQFVVDAKTMGGAGVYTLYITDANNKVVGVKKIVLQ